MTERYIVIGDVHGCYDELVELLDRHPDRHVIFVGDLVDKGPRPHRVLELAKLLKATVVMGNHEDNHIRWADHEARLRATGKKNPMRRDDSFKAQHAKIQSSSLDLITYMKSFPYFVRLPALGPLDKHGVASEVVVLHGGLLPGHTPEDMRPDKMCRVRNVKHKVTKKGEWPGGWSFATLDECEADTSLPFWTSLYTGQDWILYGHAAFYTAPIKGRTVGLDTGCVYGNKLSAMLLPEWEIVSVAARKTYMKKDHW